MDDSDTGPNNFQNFPVLTRATNNPGVTTIEGTLGSAPDMQYRLEFFANRALTTNALGNGGGEIFIGWTNVITDATGSNLFRTILPINVVSGQVITATATDTNNNTSELSAWILLDGGAVPDTDGDGILDFWENLYGLSPTNGADALLDPDLDSFTSLQEYIANTIPTNPAHFIRISAISNTPTKEIIFFTPTVTDRAHRLQFSSGGENAIWSNALGPRVGLLNTTMYTNTINIDGGL
ncbi:MAG: hypothetical protein GKR87_12540 [Kiritimatiellae bacterium]|nr:hypothetical protein [Kiritimatiellia bacterium]